MKKIIAITFLLSLFGLWLKAGQYPIYPNIQLCDTCIIEVVEMTKFTPKTFPKYLGKGFLHTSIFNLYTWTSLLVMPQSVSKWDPATKFKYENIRAQYILSYTKAPMIDTDLWTINYLGHPYQGSIYYNSVRSQGASVWESGLFCLSQSLLWEYVWEGGMEQPSIQDIIVTPVLGFAVGELTHRVAIKMGKNGYKWHEKVIISIINPNYAINVGFGRKKIK